MKSFQALTQVLALKVCSHVTKFSLSPIFTPLLFSIVLNNALIFLKYRAEYRYVWTILYTAADARREYALMLLLLMICIFPTTDCNAGFGDNGRGECVACGDGSYSGAREASCAYCGPNTNTGGNDEATSSAECGT